MAEKSTDSIINRLFNEGEYTHILRRIFSYLDGASIHCAGLVNTTWRQFIKKEVWNSPVNRRRLWEGWREGVPATRRLELRAECLTMVADERSVFCGLGDGRVDVYYRASLTRETLLSGHKAAVTSLSVDARLIVSGSWDGRVNIWCRESSVCLTTLHHKGTHIVRCQLDPPLDQASGLVRQLLYVTTRDGDVKRYAILAALPTENIRKVKLIREPQVESFCLHHEDTITCSDLGPTHVIVGSSNSKLYLWDKRREVRLKTLERHKNSVRCVYLSYPRALSGSKDKTAILWDLDKGLVLRELQHSVDVRSVYFNNKILLTTDDYKDIYIWDADKTSSLTEPCIRALTGHNGPTHSLHCEQGVLLSCDLTGVLIEKDFWLCMEEGPGMRILRCSEGVNCMVCDQTQLVVGLLNRTIEVYDRQTLQLVRVLRGHEDHVWSLDMNHKYIVSGSWDSSVCIWSRVHGQVLFQYAHPHGREISGVKILGSNILVTSLAGSLNIIEELEGSSFRIKQFIPSSPELGEIYSLTSDQNYVLTGHTLTNSSFKLWDAQDFSVKKIIMEKSNESIIWNIHLQYPIALVCRDNEVLDIYNLEKAECVKSLRHESKVLCATLYEGKIITGCQYGLLVIWNIAAVLESEKRVVGMSASQSTVYEHSAAISNIHVDSTELITNDYDGIIILRNLRHYKKYNKVWRREPQVEFKEMVDELEEDQQDQ